MTLFMIRHGETTGNVQKLFYGNMDLPLTETGRDQARALRPLLENYRFDRVYSSDLTRAVETAGLVLPGADIPDDVADGKILGADHAAQSQLVDDALIGNVAQLGDDLRNTHAAGVQGDDHIQLFPAGEGNQRVEIPEAFAFQQFGVTGIALDDGGFRKHGADGAAQSPVR